MTVKGGQPPYSTAGELSHLTINSLSDILTFEVKFITKSQRQTTASKGKNVDCSGSVDRQKQSINTGMKSHALE